MTVDMVTLSHVIVQRGRREILNVGDLAVSKGEYLGVLGPNGAGKSTLLKLCGGMLRPNRGRVYFNGQAIERFNGWRLNAVRRRIGYVPQAVEYHADLPFTVREVTSMGLTGVKGLFSRLDRDDYRQVDDWLERLGMYRLSNQTFRTLSGGEQQKVLIARAMVAHPSLLLLDEPGSNLDFVWRAELTRVLDMLYRQADITVLMVSHDADLLPACCQRAIILDGGCVCGDGAVDDMLSLWRTRGIAG